jgi:hypothetical protein
VRRLLIVFFIGLNSALAFGNIHFNAWVPDTCPESKFTYSWDDSVAVDQIVLTFVSEDQPCSYYENQGITGEDQYNAVLDENRTKNFTYQAIVDNNPEVTTQELNASGDEVTVIKNFKFYYDESRNLVIDVDGLDQASVENAKTSASAKLSQINTKESQLRSQKAQVSQ